VTINATGKATDALGAVATQTVAITQGDAAPLDKVVHYLARNRPNFNSLVDSVRQGPASFTTESDTVGLRFTVQRACTLTGARIFKAPAATGTIPVTVWNYRTQLALGHATLTWSADDGGWREFDLEIAVSLVPGTEYAISYYANAWSSTAWRFNAQTYLEWPFVVAPGVTDNGDGTHAASGCYALGSNAFPARDDAAMWYWIDPRVEYDSPVATYEGGTEYFDQWPNGGLSDFPISVFAADVGTIADYKSVGINLIQPWDLAGSRDEIVEAGATVIAGGDTLAARIVVSDPELGALVKAYNYWDEPDLQGTGNGTAEALRDKFASIRKIDSTRPLYFGFGYAMLRGQDFGWFPNGATAETVTAMWRQQATLSDITNGDDYSIANGVGIWVYGVQTDRLRDINDGRTPVFATIETCIVGNATRQPTLDEIKRAAMLSIIHGARGIVWFDHQFATTTPDGSSYPQDFQAMLHDETKRAGLTAFHGFLQSIKGGLWAPESTLERAVVSSNTTAGPVGGELGVPIDITVREAADYIYVLTQAARPGSATGTFTIPALAGSTVTVLDESRTVTVDSDGVFTDDFDSDYEYHAYRIPVPAAPVILTTKLAPLASAVSASQTLEALGDPTITWSVQSGSIAGMSLSSGGVLSGTPSSAGSYTITIRATNSEGHFDRTFTGTIAAAPTAPTITTTNLGSLTEGHAASVTIAYTGSTGTSASVTVGSLPAGLTASVAAGVVTISGTPSAAGAYSCTLTVTNAAGSDTQAYSGTVDEPSTTVHSVFDDAPSGTYSALSDGGGSLVTANQFYTYGTPTHSDWKIVGARIWIPSGTTGGILTEGGHVYLLKADTGHGPFVPADGAGNALVSTMVGNGTATAFTTLTAGQWNDIPFSAEYDLNWGDGFIVGIKWTSGNYYIYHSDDNGVLAADGTHLTLSEDGAYYKGLNSLSSTQVGAHYGLDTIISES